MYAHVTPAVAASRAAFHADIVDEVAKAVAAEKVVVVGMAWNVPVRKARAQLDEAKVSYAYLEFGNYTNRWKQRLALKLWSGWPTLPMVFVNGTLVGGSSDLRTAIADGTFQALLDAPRVSTKAA